MPDELMRTAQVAKLLDVDRTTVTRWVRLGLLPAIRLPGGQLRYRRADVEKLLQQGKPE